MNVWRILAGFAGWRLALSALSGLAGGAALAALLRLVHRVLTLPATEHLWAGLQFAGLLALYFAGTVVAEHALNDTSERLQWELRRSLLRQLLERPLRQLERLGVPRLFSLLGGDVKTFADYVCWLPNVMVNLAVVAGCFAYMAWLSPLVLVFNLVFVALAATCYILPRRRSQAIQRRAAQRWDEHVGQIHYSLLALRSLLLNRNRRADFVTRHFEPTGAEVRALNGQGRLIHLLTERFAEAFALANVACLLFVLPRFISLTPATATGLLLAALFVRAPLKDLLAVLPRTQQARLALQRMAEAGLDPRPVTEAASPSAVAVGNFNELTLERAEFHYDSDHGQTGFVAGPFSLTVKAGEIVFIVGGNGAGKTTLAKLLCGLYSPDAGHVLLNRLPVVDGPQRDELRRQFSAVFTDDPLFSHVLGIGPDQAARRGPALLEEFKLTHKVSLDGARFSTIDLSQGQRRRLVLLNALLEDRPVLLLDEWAADQDPEFRVFFYDHIIPNLRARGRTLIVITHDDRYFDRADRVIKLETGRLAS